MSREETIYLLKREILYNLLCKHTTHNELNPDEFLNEYFALGGVGLPKKAK